MIDDHPLRVRTVNNHPLRPDGDFVLYWMIANRRPHWNFSLDRAIEWCRELKKPLVVLEALRVGYRWASDRIHRFVVEGMAANETAFDGKDGVLYYPYLEARQHDGQGLIEAFASKACVVVTDDFPCFFLPALVRIAGRKLNVRLEAVDGNGLLPMRAAPKTFDTAFAFRRFLQKELRPYLSEVPHEHPLRRMPNVGVATLPADWRQRWPKVESKALANPAASVAACEIDHSVPGVESLRGGWQVGESILQRFLHDRLSVYGEKRNEPDEVAASGFSPYLHFGYLSTHQILAGLGKKFDWTPGKISDDAAGKREGWWRIDPNADAFLDELVTWRELGYNMCSRQADYDKYESLPEWARKTLAEHENDPRPEVYSLDELERAKTYDPLWNAAQRQLLREGRIHNYLRMLWGKKIFQWSPTPRDALAAMIELNNKYALDGRNPNSYSGIFWTLGRYDRAWGPERPIFGKIRYMTSENTARKMSVEKYLDRFGEESAGPLFG